MPEGRKVPVEGLRLRAIDARLAVTMLDQAADAASALNVTPLNALVVFPRKAEQSTTELCGIGGSIGLEWLVATYLNEKTPCRLGLASNSLFPFVVSDAIVAIGGPNLAEQSLRLTRHFFGWHIGPSGRIRSNRTMGDRVERMMRQYDVTEISHFLLGSRDVGVEQSTAKRVCMRI